MEFLKSVTEPIQEIALRSSLRGLVHDFDHYNEDVLLLEGETHLGRKPVRSVGVLLIHMLDSLLSTLLEIHCGGPYVSPRSKSEITLQTWFCAVSDLFRQ